MQSEANFLNAVILTRTKETFKKNTENRKTKEIIYNSRFRFEKHILAENSIFFLINILLLLF